MNLKTNWKRFWTLSRNRDGFTLVELIVVIAILAILAGVAVPAYTGYINKANKASDLQLLGAVNTAFGAACMENGKSASNLEDGEVNVIWAGNSVDGVTLYDEEFQKYYKGNEASEFKVIKLLTFKDGVFSEASEAMQNLYNALLSGNADDIAALKGSEFAEMGMASVLDKVEFATLVAGMMANGDDGDGIYSSKFDTLINGDANKAALAKYLGLESLNSQEYLDLLSEKATLLAKENGESMENPDVIYDYMEQAEKELLTSNAVLVAATNYSYISEDFVTALSNGTAKQTIVDNIANDPADAIAQAGFAYAMYTAYASKNEIPVSEDLSLDEVYDALESEDFQDYMTNSSADDIAGYEAAMNMVNSASGDKETVSSLLVNGYNDPNLLALLTQLTTSK